MTVRGKAVRWLFERAFQAYPSEAMAAAQRRFDLTEVVYQPSPAGPLAGPPLRLPAADPHSRKAVAGDTVSPEIVRFFRRFDAERYVFFDVGANVGLITRQIAATMPNISAVHCFEPNPNSLVFLRHNTAHLPSVTVHPVALSDRNQVTQLIVSGRNTGNCSFHSDVVRQASGSISVEAANANDRIPSLLPQGQRALWKSDTEGHDATIIGALPLSFWSRVDAAAVELWAPLKPLSPFLSALSSFPHKALNGHPTNEAAILAALTDRRRRFDLFLWR